MNDNMLIAQKLDFFRNIALFWSEHLSTSEIKLLYWIAANTLGRGKLSGTYSLTQFANGIPNRKEGGWWCGGVGMSESSVRRAIDKLRERGVIATERTHFGTKFTINTEWQPG